MIVTCTKCRTRFRVPEERIGPKGARIRCGRCQHVFVVQPPAAPVPGPAAWRSDPDPARPAPPIAAAPPPAAPADDPFAPPRPAPGGVSPAPLRTPAPPVDGTGVSELWDPFGVTQRQGAQPATPKAPPKAPAPGRPPASPRQAVPPEPATPPRPTPPAVRPPAVVAPPALAPRAPAVEAAPGFGPEGVALPPLPLPPAPPTPVPAAAPAAVPAAAPAAVPAADPAAAPAADPDDRTGLSELWDPFGITDPRAVPQRAAPQRPAPASAPPSAREPAAPRVPAIQATLELAELVDGPQRRGRPSAGPGLDAAPPPPSVLDELAPLATSAEAPRAQAPDEPSADGITSTAALTLDLPASTPPREPPPSTGAAPAAPAVQPAAAEPEPAGATPTPDPLRAPRPRRLGPFLRAGVPLAVAVALGALAVFGDVGARLRGRAATADGAVSVVGLRSGPYETRSGAPVLVVRGEVVARRAVKGRVAVRVDLVEGGAVTASAVALAGAQATPEDVFGAGEPEAAAALRRRLDAAAVEALAAGARAPFLAVLPAASARSGLELRVTAAPAPPAAARGP